MAKALKKLEARVSALEAESRQSRKEAAAARAEAQALRRRIGTRKPAVAAVTVPAASMPVAVDTSTKLYNKASPIAPATLGWTGLYVGAAGGGGWMHGNEALGETSNVSSVFSTPTTTDVDTSTGTETGSLTGRNPGAMASLFVGYNYMLSNNWLIGGQLEGTLANTRVGLNGSGSTTSTSTSVTTPPGGAAGTSTSTTTGTFSGLPDTLDNRWSLSVLARAGFLVDPSDVVYLIGGYTYGRFEAELTGFGMHGGTIGVGWERQIISGWNLRAEYRYTRFGSETVNLVESSTSTASTTGAVPASTTLASTTSVASHFSDVDMHSVWLGVSHSFGP